MNKLPGVYGVNGNLTVGDNIGPGIAHVILSAAEQINSAAANTETIGSNGSLQLPSTSATFSTPVNTYTVWNVPLSGTTSGTFTLSFGGSTTVALAL